MLRHAMLWRVSVAVMAGVLAAAGGLGPAAGSSSARQQVQRCDDRGRDAELLAAEAGILTLLDDPFLGDLTRLDDEADLARLAALGYGLYDHQQVSFRGMGWAVVESSGAEITAVRPLVLLYAPTVPLPPLTVTEPRDGFDFPYRLAGWAYSPQGRYDLRQSPAIPGLSCIERREWFVHERGFHPFSDGGMRPVPPSEETDGQTPHGTSFGEDIKPLATQMLPGDIPHPRVWDLHMWRTSGVPVVSMLNPGLPLPGVDPGVDSFPPAFFFPPRIADLSVVQLDWPDPAELGHELTYLVRVRNHGPDVASAARLDVTVSGRFRWRSATAAQGMCSTSHHAAVCELGVIGAGDEVTVQLIVRPTRRGTLSSTATASGPEGDLTWRVDPRTPDSTDDALLWTDATANNFAAETTTIR